MNISGFVSERLLSFKNHPEMWGGNEAIELQAIQLLEIEYFILKPNIPTYQDIMKLYTKEFKRNIPLYKMYENTEEFVNKLFEVCQNVRNKLYG